VVIAAALSGCSEQTTAPYELGSAAVLFGRNASPYDATAFGRGPWPATTAGYESVERRTFSEYYRDFPGNSLNERNTPIRRFRSYRTGTQLR
jgi:hypothetical protein